jgi:hypothetical protein
MRKVQIAVFLVAGFAGHAYAGLLGSSVVSQYYAYGGTYNSEGSPTSFVANGTVQETFCSGCSGSMGFNLTVTNTQIDYVLFGTGPWSPSPVSLNSGGLYITNGNLLTFTGATITGVTIDGSSTLTGFTAANLTFNSGNIAVDWQNLGVAGQQLVLDVTSTGGSSVPEPAAWITLLAGFAGLGILRRFKNA